MWPSADFSEPDELPDDRALESLMRLPLNKIGELLALLSTLLGEL